MSYDKVIEFTAAVRGYHYYRRFWKPEPSQKLNCFFEEGNPFDPFAIKVCEIGKTTAVGHLPREISRATKFFIDRGGRLSLILTSGHYRRSPLVQGGMEIGCKVTVTIPGTCINILILKKYQDIIEENYTEPKEETIIGSYLVPHDASEVIQEARAKTTNTKKKMENVKLSAPKCKDIRTFFQQPRAAEKQNENDDQQNRQTTIVID